MCPVNIATYKCGNGDYSLRLSFNNFMSRTTDKVDLDALNGNIKAHIRLRLYSF